MCRSCVLRGMMLPTRRHAVLLRNLSSGMADMALIVFGGEILLILLSLACMSCAHQKASKCISLLAPLIVADIRLTA